MTPTKRICYDDHGLRIYLYQITSCVLGSYDNINNKLIEAAMDQFHRRYDKYTSDFKEVSICNSHVLDIKECQSHVDDRYKDVVNGPIEYLKNRFNMFELDLTVVP